MGRSVKRGRAPSGTIEGMNCAGCYVHIPFCVKKCAYCDFNSHAGYTDSSVARYVNALEAEIRRADMTAHPPVDTVFFGGGTPTAIPADAQARLLRAVLETLPVTPNAEITTEANPGTIDTEHLAVLRAAGFNRISFGVQSFDAGLLKTLGRLHTADDARRAVHSAREAGFANISLDLMFALPRQSLAQWQDTLCQALELDTEHVSLYALIVEEGTGFYTLQQKGRLTLPGDDAAADMYALAQREMATAGRSQYETSNFALPGRECRHNLHYWRNEEYDGFGCGAASYRGGTRRMTVKSPVQYADKVSSGADLTLSAETLTREETMAETMMLGLRLTREGVSRARFRERFGADPAAVYAQDIETFRARGLLEVTNECIRLTPGGVFLANEVMMAFV